MTRRVPWRACAEPPTLRMPWKFCSYHRIAGTPEAASGLPEMTSHSRVRKSSITSFTAAAVPIRAWAMECSQGSPKVKTRDIKEPPTDFRKDNGCAIRQVCARFVGTLPGDGSADECQRCDGGGGPHGTPLRLGTRSNQGRRAPRGAPLHGGRQRQIRGSVPSHGARVLEVRIHLPPAVSLRTFGSSAGEARMQ